MRIIIKEILEQYDNQQYTGMMLQLCETSTGVLYDMNLVGYFCNRNGIFLFVDAVSGFLADEFSMKRMHVNAVITGSQKALSLQPSMSFTVLDAKAQKRCRDNKVKSMYFDYSDYLKNGERGQTPFTPAVATLIMLNDKLRRIEKNGGILTTNRKIRERAVYFREKIKNLPFRMFTSEESSSNCVTALMPTTKGVSAHKIFEIIIDEYGMWVCPNGGDMAEKVFRVGHIGNITNEEIDRLVEVFNDLVKRKLL